MKNALLICLVILAFSCNSSAQKNDTKEKKPFTITKTEAEWKAQLTDSEYNILRKSISS